MPSAAHSARKASPNSFHARQAGPVVIPVPPFSSAAAALNSLKTSINSRYCGECSASRGSYIARASPRSSGSCIGGCLLGPFPRRAYASNSASVRPSNCRVMSFRSTTWRGLPSNLSNSSHQEHISPDAFKDSAGEQRRPRPSSGFHKVACCTSGE
jgi:hypothetical protein